MPKEQAARKEATYNGHSPILLNLPTVRRKPTVCLYHRSPSLRILARTVHPLKGGQFIPLRVTSSESPSPKFICSVLILLYALYAMFKNGNNRRVQKKKEREKGDNDLSSRKGRQKPARRKSVGGGAATAPSYVLRDNSSKGRIV